MQKTERQTNSLRNIAVILASVLTLSTLVPAFVPVASGTSVQTLQQQARDASARIGEMEQSLATAMEALERASEELQRTEEEIAETEAVVEQIEEDIAHNREVLAARADFMYRSGPLAYFEMIFAAQNLSEFTSVLQIADRLASNDAQVLEELQVQTAELEAILDELDELRDQQEAIEAARRADANSAQRILDEQKVYVNSLNARVREALQRQQEEENRRAATRAAAPSGSNRESGSSERSSSGSSSSSGSGGSSSSGGGGDYVATGMTFSGIGSWYQVGTRTANGEAFNPDAMTAAHQTLPFGTLVRVTFRGNSVVVRINDRGPFTGGRVIDLSRGSARAIGLYSAGIGTVTVEVVERP